MIVRATSLCGLLVLASGAAAQEVQEPQRALRSYDPDAGMDRNGRVQKPKLPDDLPNPDRWRYTPEGRLKPGNMLDRFLVSSFISPIVFREEDIGFGGGLAITDVDFRNQRGRELANIIATYSAEGQQQFALTWVRWPYHRELPGGGIIREERSRTWVHAEYSRTLTRRFYGFGSRTPESNETSYAEELGVVSGRLRFSIPDPGDDLLLSAGVGLEHHALARGRVTGIPSTDASYPGEFRDGDGVYQLWLRGGVAYDTRDSLHQPYSGWRVGLDAAVAPLQSDASAGALFSGDARVVIPVSPLLHGGGDAHEDNPPTDVIAIGGFVTTAAGDLPFYSLPSLGGSETLRGFIRGRFTDRSAVHGVAEYRFAIVPRGVRLTRTIRIERLGLALFYDCGTVADDLADLADGKFLQSYGIGLRAAFAREATFRIDFAISDEDANLIIAFGNSF